MQTQFVARHKWWLSLMVLACAAFVVAPQISTADSADPLPSPLYQQSLEKSIGRFDQQAGVPAERTPAAGVVKSLFDAEYRTPTNLTQFSLKSVAGNVSAIRPEKVPSTGPVNVPNPNKGAMGGGEDVGSATVIPSLPYTDNGTTAGFVDDYNEACPYPDLGAPDAVYQFTPAVDVDVDITLCNSLYDTKVYVYESAVTAGAPYACNDDQCGDDGFKSKLQCVSLIAGTTYYIVVDGYDATSFGDYELEVVECTPCVWQGCSPSATAEGETCGDFPDVTNGGCNSSPEAFSSIAKGETVCGTSYADGINRDTDWYRIVLTDADSITWCVTASFDFDVLAIDLTNHDPLLGCEDPDLVILGSASGLACDVVCLVGNLPAGTYAFFVAPTAFAGTDCADGPWEYEATLNPEDAAPITVDDVFLSSAEICVILDPDNPCETPEPPVFVDGPVRVRRTAPPYPSGNPSDPIPTELIEMSLTGTAPNGSPIIVRVQEDVPSLGQIINPNIDPAGNFLGAVESFFDVFVEVEIELIQLTLVSREPIPLFSGPISQLPPFGVSYQTPPSQPPVPLYLKNSPPTAVPVGWICYVIHTPTEPMECVCIYQLACVSGPADELANLGLCVGDLRAGSPCTCVGGTCSTGLTTTKGNVCMEWVWTGQCEPSALPQIPGSPGGCTCDPAAPTMPSTPSCPGEVTCTGTVTCGDLATCYATSCGSPTCFAETCEGFESCQGSSTCPGSYTCIGGATCAAIETCHAVTCTAENTCAGSLSTCSGNATCAYYPSCAGTETCETQTCIGWETCSGSQTCQGIAGCTPPPTYDASSPECGGPTVAGSSSCHGSATCDGFFTCMHATCAAIETCQSVTCTAEATCWGSAATCSPNATCPGYASCNGTATCGSNNLTCIGSATCQGSSTCDGAPTCAQPTFQGPTCEPTVCNGVSCAGAQCPPTMASDVSCTGAACPTSAAMASCAAGQCPTIVGAATCSAALCVTTQGSPSCAGGPICPTMFPWPTCSPIICIPPTQPGWASCGIAACPTWFGAATCPGSLACPTPTLAPTPSCQGTATCALVPCTPVTMPGAATCAGAATCPATATCNPFGLTCAGVATCAPAASCAAATCPSASTCSGFATCDGTISCQGGHTCTGNATCKGTLTCDPVAVTCEGNPTCNLEATCGGWPTCMGVSTCMSSTTCNANATCGGSATCPSAATCLQVATCDGNPTCVFSFTCDGWPTCQPPPHKIPKRIGALIGSTILVPGTESMGIRPEPFHFDFWRGPVHPMLFSPPDPCGLLSPCVVPPSGSFFDVFFDITVAAKSAAVVETVLVVSPIGSSGLDGYRDSDSDGEVSSGDYVLIVFTDPVEIANESAWYLVQRVGTTPAGAPKSVANAFVLDLLAEIPPASVCACDCHADPACDGVTNVLDVVQAVNVAFRGAPSLTDPNPACPNETTDVNCDAVTNVLDVVRLVNVAFRGGDPAVEFCDPCAP